MQSGLETCLWLFQIQAKLKRHVTKQSVLDESIICSSIMQILVFVISCPHTVINK